MKQKQNYSHIKLLYYSGGVCGDGGRLRTHAGLLLRSLLGLANRAASRWLCRLANSLNSRGAPEPSNGTNHRCSVASWDSAVRRAERRSGSSTEEAAFHALEK